MPIDSNIALGYKAPEFQDPLNSLARMMQVQGMQQQSELHGMQADKYRRDLGDENKLAEIYKTAMSPDGTIDRSRLYSGAASGGLGAKIPALQKTFMETDEAKVKLEKGKLELGLQRVDLAGRLLGKARDQASYDLVKQEAQAEGVDTSKFPPQFDPGWVQAKRAETMSVKDQLTQRHQELTLAETTTHNRNTERTAAGQLSVAQGRLKEDVRHHGVTEGHAGEANRLKGQEVQNDKGSGLPVLGVPVPAVTPWANQSNPKDANKVKASHSASGAKEIEKDLDAARSAAATAAAAQRFIELNKKINTGGVVDKTSIGRWAQSFGSEYAELESITAKLVPGMREPGSGTTSDADLALFKSATVGVDKPGKTNENIAKGLIVRGQQMQEYADFRQTYLEQNGTLQGADRHWKDYVNANPIFDASKPDSFALNPKRKSWGEHFKAAPAKSGNPTKPAPAAGGVIDFGALQ